ncbi:MAG TPA: hypothetical protein VG327_06195 [Mycobacterium sp.]|nr:hypothetical protein [Mycobacterium sp.]
MPPHRDVAAYDERAVHYNQGWRGRLHHTIGDRTAALAATTGNLRNLPELTLPPT